MADFNRIFKKSTILDIIEGEFDAALKLDSPDFKVIGWHVNAKTKKLTVYIHFTAMQGTVQIERGRMLTIDLTTMPTAARQRFLGQYNFIADNIVKVLPELSDAVEQ